MNPEKQEILEIIRNHIGAPPTAAEIYDASNLITDKQKVYSHCCDLRSAGLIEAVKGEKPNRYRITATGIAALDSENTEMGTAEAQESARKSGRALTGTSSDQLPVNCPSNKRGLAAALEEMIGNRLTIEYEPQDLELMAATLKDVYRVLEPKFRDYKDLEDFRKSIDLIEALRQQMETSS